MPVDWHAQGEILHTGRARGAGPTGHFRSTRSITSAVIQAPPSPAAPPRPAPLPQGSTPAAAPPRSTARIGVLDTRAALRADESGARPTPTGRRPAPRGPRGSGASAAPRAARARA